jgi:3D (Asp-Asp-Asp) domain-containing protein
MAGVDHTAAMRRWLPLPLITLALTGCSDSPDEPGWEATVYYTAVESFHDGAPVEVRGCPVLECEGGDDLLGVYPEDFVQAVEDEGTGRITSGEQAGQYLNWSYDVGYWLDTEPRNSHGDPLRPYVSAAADPEVLAEGTRLRITDCGDAADVEPEVCEALQDAEWTIEDEFTPGLGGERHIDLYLGEEDQADFTESAWYTTLTNARIDLQ